MRRFMELHAEGLEMLGHQATLLFSEQLGARCFERPWSRLSGARSLSMLASRYGEELPDVINVHTQCAPAWLLARRAGLIKAKIVVMSHAADEGGIAWTSPRDLLRWLRVAAPARATFRSADGIWCVNRQDVEFYVAKYGIERHRLVCLPPAVKPIFYEAAASGQLRSSRTLLFVGTWIHRKGVDILCAALERVVAKVPGVHLVLAGTLSGEARVRADLPTKLAERTLIVDSLGDAELAALYRTSSLLLLPSRREGLPLALLEAMACGCPALAAANSGMLDVIEPGRTGWLETSFDPDAWAMRILDLLSRPTELEAASDGARRKSQAFRVEAVAARAISWYSQLLGAGR
jgi:glycosyltransferase involved in cell wall biosynthesis